MPEGEIFLFDLTSFKHKQGVTLFQSRRLFLYGITLLFLSMSRFIIMVFKTKIFQRISYTYRTTLKTISVSSSRITQNGDLIVNFPDETSKEKASENLKSVFKKDVNVENFPRLLLLAGLVMFLMIAYCQKFVKRTKLSIIWLKMEAK